MPAGAWPPPARRSIFSYAIAGVIAYLLMRALGELIMYRQTSGSFVSYAGEMFGKKGAYVSGWMYFINWAMTGIAELIAIGLYFQFFFPNVPVELSAIAALLLLVGVNLLSVKAFGEFEFWASCLKVGAILIFLAVGTFMVVTNAQVGDGNASVNNLFAAEGGMFPEGALVMTLVLNAVIFAYNGIELVGITAGEMQDPAKEVPKAIRAVVFRIVVFYVGSVTLLAMLLPSDQYVAGTSPFVTVFGQMGLGWMGDVMNMIVITAALSSCNSGLYSIGRIFRTMANNGHAPEWLTRMSKSHVPYAAILAIGGVYLVGILLNIWLGGSHAFDLALNSASIGVIFTWGAIFASQIALRPDQRQGLGPSRARRSLGQLGRPDCPAAHHGPDRFRHHDRRNRRGLPPRSLDPGDHPVLRAPAVARLAQGQEQRAEERSRNSRRSAASPANDDGGPPVRGPAVVALEGAPRSAAVLRHGPGGGATKPWAHESGGGHPPKECPPPLCLE